MYEKSNYIKHGGGKQEFDIFSLLLLLVTNCILSISQTPQHKQEN